VHHDDERLVRIGLAIDIARDAIAIGELERDVTRTSIVAMTMIISVVPVIVIGESRYRDQSKHT
jgi:hypothetical protein